MKSTTYLKLKSELINKGGLIMQVQENDGVYRKPEKLGGDLEDRTRRIQEVLEEENVRRILIFPGYDENGRPTAEMRRAWGRWNRTKQRN